MEINDFYNFVVGGVYTPKSAQDDDPWEIEARAMTDEQLTENVANLSAIIDNIIKDCNAHRLTIMIPKDISRALVYFTREQKARNQQ